ncbi:hypothetical protein SRABI128_05498 [Microbacterium sp. Bi128]|nr:hypothetical protein SRABI128_05498 [Microbacterium sp. Bi128]
MVAVEADQRHQLPDHLQDLGDHHQQQRIEAGGPPDAHDRDGHDGVEVQSAEVRAQPAAAPQPVGIRDVGIEGRPHQIQAGPHGAGGGSAAAGGGGVAELMETGREHRDHQDQKHQAGVGEGLMRCRCQTLDHQHPPARGQEGRGHSHHDQGVEQRGERRGDLPGAVRIGHRVPEAHTQQRVRFLYRGLGAVRQLQEAEGEQLGSDQGADVLGTDEPSETVAGVPGDFFQAPLAVDRLEHQVQQSGELDGLAVGTAHEGRGFLVTGPLRLADQLDAGGPHRNRVQADRRGRRRAGSVAACTGSGVGAGRCGGGCGAAGGRQGRRAVLPGRPSVHSAHLGATASGRTAGQPTP